MPGFQSETPRCTAHLLSGVGSFAHVGACQPRDVAHPLGVVCTTVLKHVGHARASTAKSFDRSAALWRDTSLGARCSARTITGGLSAATDSAWRQLPRRRVANADGPADWEVGSEPTSRRAVSRVEAVVAILRLAGPSGSRPIPRNSTSGSYPGSRGLTTPTPARLLLLTSVPDLTLSGLSLPDRIDGRSGAPRRENG